MRYVFAFDKLSRVDIRNDNNIEIILLVLKVCYNIF